MDVWSPDRDPTVLGAVVHGPALVAESPGIAMAVRCVFARPDGLELDLVLRAVGVRAEAAARQTFGEHAERLRGTDGGERGWPAGSEPDVVIEVDGRRAVAYPYEQSSGGGEDQFVSELRVALPGLPSDGRVTLIASWPEAGLDEGGVTLALSSLDDLESRVVSLPP